MCRYLFSHFQTSSPRPLPPSLSPPLALSLSDSLFLFLLTHLFLLTLILFETEF